MTTELLDASKEYWNAYLKDNVKIFEFNDEYKNTFNSIINTNNNDNILISDKKRQNIMNNLTKNWDKFYNKNILNFFKDRQYLNFEFNELNNTNNDNKSKLLIEIGCGVGNSLIPILIKNKNINAIGVDCSKNAINLLNKRWRIHCKELSDNKYYEYNPNKMSELLKKELYLQKEINKINELFINESKMNKFKSKKGAGYIPIILQKQQKYINELNKIKSEYDINNANVHRLNTDIWDILSDNTPNIIKNNYNKADYVLIMFVLSSIPKKFHESVLHKISKLLKPNGYIFFRDYGEYDYAQLRFQTTNNIKNRKKLNNKCFVRKDNTLTYFFNENELKYYCYNILKYNNIQIKMHCREIKNRKYNRTMKRIWYQCKFQKPSSMNYCQII